MRNLFIISQLLSETAFNNSNMELDTQENILLQIKSYAFYLTMQLLDVESGSYLVEALSESNNLELFQMIGGSVAGWLKNKIPVIINTNS